MAHIFISYHKNSSREYARKLADYLIASGFDVWIDDRIDYGANWERVIFEAIDAAGAFLVIMTPDAYKSDWVQAERLYARQVNKSIYPLLLDGNIFPAYLGWQVADVRGGALPSEEFLNDLAAAGVARHAGAGRNVAEKVTPQSSSRPHSPSPVTTTPVSAPKTTGTQARRFEAAMPSQTVEHASTEVWAKVSLPDSPGLRAELPAVVPSGDVIAKEDARATSFPFKFPIDPATGEAQPVTVTIRARSDALAFDQAEQSAELPPDFDSQTVVFNATLNASSVPGSRVRVTLDLVYNGRVIAQIALSTFVQTVAAAPVKATWVLAGAAVGSAPTPPTLHGGTGGEFASADEADGKGTPGEQLRGAVGGRIELADDDIDLSPGRIREEAAPETSAAEPQFDRKPSTSQPAPPPPPITAPQAPPTAEMPAARLDDGAEEYDRYAPVASAKRRSVSLTPIALVASLALVAFVVLFLQRGPATLSSEDASATFGALVALTQVSSSVEPTETQLALLETTQTAIFESTRIALTPEFTATTARGLTQTAVIVQTMTAAATMGRTPTEPVSQGEGALRPVTVGIVLPFDSCPDDTADQLQARLSERITHEPIDAGQVNFDDLSPLASRYDLVVWGTCAGEGANATMEFNVAFLTSDAPPEVFEVERISVINVTDAFEYFAQVANAAIFYAGGAYADAIAAFDAAITTTPANGQIMPFQLLTGNSYLFAGQPENALEQYELAAVALNLLPLAYNNRAIAETDLLLRDGRDNVPEGVSLESALTYLETAHLNTSDPNQQAVILTNMGLTTNYFTENYDAARSRCQDALNFNPAYEMADVCLVAVAASEVGTSEQQCPLLESAQATVQASLLENATATDSYAEADMLFWQAFLFGIWEVCEPGQSFGDIAAELRAERAELLAAQPIHLQPDRFE